jgi:hypothetical protein
MRLPSTKVILFNAGAIVVAGAAIFGAAHSMLSSSVTPPCGERYLKMTAFSLERGGAMLTATDLQAMSGGRDVGVVQNVSIVRKEGPAPLAVEVRLQKGSAGGEDGMGFPWEPRALAGKTAACLSYHVFLPKDFDFRRSGRLPGLAGGAEQTDTFVVPVTWDANGRAGFFVRTASGPGVLALAEVKLPKGRWTKIEQELVLNAPTAGNGILRVWVDGELAIDRKDLTYRKGDHVSLSAVAADVHYTGPAVAADKAGKIWLSPFEVRWQ